MRIAVIVSSFISLFMLTAMSLAKDTNEKVVYKKDSLYQHITVAENTVKKERYIYTEKISGVQGAVSLTNPERLIFNYTKTAHVSLAFLDKDPTNVLVIGLGAGAIPRYLNRYYPDAQIDIVEIDPDILDVAKKYFFFKENNRMRVHIADGRIFIKKTKNKYDLIVLDAYKGYDIPFHLTTLEFLKEAKSKLKDDGAVVSNVLSSSRNKFFDAMVSTHSAAFQNLYVFNVSNTSNYIFIVPKANTLRSAQDVYWRARAIQAKKKFDINIVDYAAAYEKGERYLTRSPVLTDDFAPVNVYQHMK